uniref:Putative bovine pancreatic trypsin inhibitor n=1 Tax=Rhipicephalus microplus TaxID=6941 RepID=A0A6G5A9J1_RHIMP
MLKCSFVVILILCNIVPLNAGLKFWNIFSWGKRTTTTTTAPRRWPWYNYTFIKPSCNGGKGIYITCLYPDTQVWYKGPKKAPNAGAAQRWPRKRVAESKVQTLRQRRPGPSYGRNYTVSDCKLKRGHCIYPLACLCPKPLQGGYYRAPPDEYHWYYDNRTNKCVNHTYDPAGCNNFDKFEKCNTYCNNATQIVKKLWPPKYWRHLLP